ncbi:hypothetical protein GIB67_014244 [Kingdonia uniflora]|uniref:Uncharacterized protein n=1 Tax=Kingdonia uniflora TaxID=39325 RepID=A0A7J7M1X8_9MAGN|nr:hypothetical protein GIB67_014244 [Kingdonia uniflora]
MYAKFNNRHGEVIPYYKGSSIWRGIQATEQLVGQHMGWVIGNGDTIDFWRDCWATNILLGKYINLSTHL